MVVNPNKNNAVAWNNGNVYAGHDGNVYQRTDDGWQQHTSNGWQPVQPNSDVQNRLDQQRQARDVGQQRFGNSAQQVARPRRRLPGRGVGASGAAALAAEAVASTASGADRVLRSEISLSAEAASNESVKGGDEKA